MGLSKTPVVGAVECNGKVVGTSSKRDGRHSQTFLCGAVSEKVSLLVTGEWIGYKGLGPRLAVCPGAPTRSARSIRTSLRASGRFTNPVLSAPGKVSAKISADLHRAAH